MSSSTTRRCDACGLPPRLSADGQVPLPLRRCSRCQKAWYHSAECQRRHFSVHKTVCRPPTISAPKRAVTEDARSSNVHVKERAGRGRCLVASVMIPSGQPIAPPPASCASGRSFSCLVPPVLNQANRSSRCALCFGLLNQSSSDVCQNDLNLRTTTTNQYGVFFCSLTCRSKCQPWLEEEERLVFNACRENDKMIVLPTAMLLFRVLRTIALEESMLQSDVPARAVMPTRKKVDSLEGHEHSTKLSVDEQTHAGAIVTLVRRLLQKRVQSVDAQQKSIVESFSVDYMLQIVSRIKTNAFTICDGENLALGVGLFEMASNMNHSCRPNVLQTFVYGAKGEPPSLRVTACRIIQPNEEACISYIDNTCPRNKRRQRLLRDYHFWCTCECCCDDKQEDCLVGLLYPTKGCKGRIADKLTCAGSQRDSPPNDASWECDRCGNTDFAMATALIEAFHSQQLDGDKAQATINERERMYSSLKANFSPSSWYVCESGEQLAQSLLDAISVSDPTKTQRLCARAFAVFDELLSRPAPQGDDVWGVLKRQVLLYKRAKLELYLNTDPRRALADLEGIKRTLMLYYPKDHELLAMLNDTMTQAFG